MLKRKTYIPHKQHNIIGGEWIAAENNIHSSTVNLMPEFPLIRTYRGNFHAVQTSTRHLNLLNTAHCEEDDENARNNSGELLLRWLKTSKVPGSQDKYTTQVREKVVTVPALPDCEALSNGWLYLKMIRLEGTQGDVSFYDEVLGNVELRFELLFAAVLPDDGSTHAILPLAAVSTNQQGNIEEIIQQQFGPGVLWVPNDVKSDYSDSSSSGSSSSGEIESSSSVEEPPVIPPPEESSSSTEKDETVIEVTLLYDETSCGNFSGMGIENHHYLLNLTGSFTAASNYPANGYTLQMTGSAVKDYGDGEIITENISWQVILYRNKNAGRWDIYHLRISDWAGFYQEQNSEDDIDFSTPVYIFPDLQTMPTYPAGTIQVDHHLIYGVSNNIPDNDLTSSLIITFTRV